MMAIRNLDAPRGADPQLNRDGKGGLTSWPLLHDVLSFLDSKLERGFEAIETGSSVSSLIFTLGGARHTAIAHHPGRGRERRQVLPRPEHHHIETLTLINDRSEITLPRLREDRPLDLVLIDGRRVFPTPIIDWCYTAIRPRVGGLMIADDLALKTGRSLAELMDVDQRL